MKKIFTSVVAFCLIVFNVSCDNSNRTDNQKSDSTIPAKTEELLPTIITDFENPDHTLNPPYDGDVYCYTDESENPKGTSTINERFKKSDGTTGLNLIYEKGKGANNSNRFLRISGNVTTTFQYGFAGCGFNLKKNREPIDISQFKGIKFWAKGYGDNYIFKVESPLVADKSFHECKFFADNNWREFVVYFKDLIQPEWKKTNVKLEDALKSAIGFQWQTASRPIDNYFLCLDNIEFVK